MIKRTLVFPALLLAVAGAVQAQSPLGLYLEAPSESPTVLRKSARRAASESYHCGKYPRDHPGRR